MVFELNLQVKFSSFMSYLNDINELRHVKLKGLNKCKISKVIYSSSTNKDKNKETVFLLYYRNIGSNEKLGKF